MINSLCPCSSSSLPSFPHLLLTVVKGNGRKRMNAVTPSPDHQEDSSGVNLSACLDVQTDTRNKINTIGQNEQNQEQQDKMRMEAEKDTHRHRV